MTIILEVIRAALLGILFLYLLKVTKNSVLKEQRGWNFMLAGFGFLFLGTLIDITDEFPGLAYFVIIGPTETQAFIEKIVGYSLGSVFMFLGSVKFIPTILRSFQMQDELMESNENLEVKIKERTSQLETANKIKSDFISVVSHEIRTPLNAISGMTHLLDQSGMSQQQAEFIGKINIAVKQLLEIFNNILDYSDLDGGKYSDEKENFRISQVVDGLIKIFNDRAAKKELILKTEFDELNSTILYGYVNVLKKILSILLDNAIKFTNSGEIVVQISEMKQESNSTNLICSIVDTGIGIPEDKIHNITEYFFQLEEALTRKFGGVGLGLAVCRKLLTFVDGDLEIESKVNVGSRFTVTIPFIIVDVDKEEDSITQPQEDIEIIKKTNTEIKTLKKNDTDEILSSLIKIEKLLIDFDGETIDEINKTDFGLIENDLSKIKVMVKNYQFEEALIEIRKIISSVENSKINLRD